MASSNSRNSSAESTPHTSILSLLESRPQFSLLVQMISADSSMAALVNDVDAAVTLLARKQGSGNASGIRAHETVSGPFRSVADTFMPRSRQCRPQASHIHLYTPSRQQCDSNSSRTNVEILVAVSRSDCAANQGVHANLPCV
jgi:hypothetical protein